MTRRILTAALVGVLFLVTGCTTDNPVEPAQEADSIQELSHPVLDATALKDFIENQTAGKVPTENFVWVAGPPFLPGPCVTDAANGESIEVNGFGLFSIHPKAVGPTFVGVYTRKDADGNVVTSGTYEATEMISFVAYPPATGRFIGGQLFLRIELDTGEKGILNLNRIVS